MKWSLQLSQVVDKFALRPREEPPRAEEDEDFFRLRETEATAAWEKSWGVRNGPIQNDKVNG